MLARKVATLFPDFMPVTHAVHAATMLRNGLETIISVDADFDQMSEIGRVAPEST